MLVVSPTKLELFRKYMTGEMNEYFTEQMVIDSIKGVRRTSFKANFGTALHLILEKGYTKFYNPETNLFYVYIKGVKNPFVFKKDELKPILDYIDNKKSSVNEVPVKKVVDTGSHQVSIRMKIDEMSGNSVTDHKTSDKPFKVNYFENSLQWKIYCFSTEASIFYYNFFQYSFDENNGHKMNIKHTRFNLYPYNNMDVEIYGWINHFVHFCELNGLMNFITYDK